MNEYFDGAVGQLRHRCEHLLTQIQPTLCPELRALAERCRTRIGQIHDTLKGLATDPLLRHPAAQRERLRALRRLVVDLDRVERFGVAALARANEDDRDLNALVDKIVKEIRYPLLPPTVTSLSQEYFYYYHDLRLLCVPLAESRFLLHLPDLYHELAHPLFNEEHNPLVKPLQTALFAAIQEAQFQVRGMIDREGRRRGPDLFLYYFGNWENCWVTWTQEFFCDVFAAVNIGPAYAWAHLHLCATRGDDPYYVPTLDRTSHPADSVRLDVILRALDQLGFGSEIAAVRAKWGELVDLRAARPEPEFHRCYPTTLVNSVVDLATGALEKMGCRTAQPGGGGPVYKLLNEAWDTFWRDPEHYPEWEQQRVEGLHASHVA